MTHNDDTQSTLDETAIDADALTDLIAQSLREWFSCAGLSDRDLDSLRGQTIATGATDFELREIATHVAAGIQQRCESSTEWRLSWPSGLDGNQDIVECIPSRQAHLLPSYGRRYGDRLKCVEKRTVFAAGWRPASLPEDRDNG